MEENGNKQESNASATGVYELPGEPAVVINGVPEIVPGCSAVPSGNASSIVGTHGNLGLGEWFVGRDVLKLFKGNYFSGKVTDYEKESGWYRVLYEDGDSEDLDWQELKEVLRPLDVTISLKTLAQRVIRKNISI
ncbi:dirigent protein 17 isoform X2 [Cicer arietinum]|uniref:Dirigent protein 17 isoform X2 n=1 Tax=Cicer arietinum TaxID=3827 RepID=A0A1S2XSM7_CICAR|nr:dirigent protein 17 isoform X2 [Cicer arietinum]